MSRYYLSTFGIVTSERTFAEAQGQRKALRAIFAYSAGSVEAIRQLIAWPEAPTPDWEKGFLAGIFDAEGSYSQGVWRISNCDPQIIDATTRSLAALGFDYVLEPSGRPNGLVTVRLRRGLREALRFFHTTDPAITRKRSIDGVALKSDAKLQVAEIKPLGIEMPMYDITTGTGDFIANGVVSHNCFARNTHTYLDLDAGHDFDSKVVVKVNAPELLRKTLASARWKGEHIAMGTNVDCYQRAEGKYELMRGHHHRAAGPGQPVLDPDQGHADPARPGPADRGRRGDRRGAELLRGICRQRAMADPGAGHAQPGAAAGRLRHPDQGRAALRRADGPDRAVPVRLPRPAGGVGPAHRRQRRGARDPDHLAPAAGHPRVVPALDDHHPELVRRYLRFYGRGAYAPKAYQAEISGQVRELAQRFGVGSTTPAAAPHRPAHRRGTHRAPRASSSAHLL